MFNVIEGSIYDVSNRLENDKYRCCVTSPPYFGLRSYGDHQEEIGKDSSLEDYIGELCDAFDDVRDKLTDDGTLWVNIGDCYNGSGGAGSDYKEGGIKANKNKWGSRRVEGLAPKNLIGVGWRFALEMQRRGWILRSEIIWNKSKAYPQPEAYIKRPVPKHETIFMFAKSHDYHYNPANLFSVWDITPVSKSSHEAPYPIELAERCILAGSDEGDWVLDPFAGSGTTGVAAILNRRNTTMVELYPEIAQKCYDRLRKTPQREDDSWV
jgi:site-specific DNA-methyltransferase (cytosine-N4-specific)